jgi:hypothetical protein
VKSKGVESLLSGVSLWLTKREKGRMVFMERADLTRETTGEFFKMDNIYISL